MSDFFKKFKSVFVAEEVVTENASPAAGQSQVSASQQAASPQPKPLSSSPGAVSDKFVEILASALEKSNQPGFDYFEFRQALVNLSKMPMDEQTRYKSAFAMAQTMGATQANLLESAQFYLQVLAGEQSKFNEAHALQRSKLIGTREEEIKNLEAAIQQKTNQMQELTQQIEAARKSSEQIRSEINDSTVKIEKTKSDFDTTFVTVMEQLQNDAAKIKQYL
jgi:hypothetical protein